MAKTTPDCSDGGAATPVGVGRFIHADRPRCQRQCGTRDPTRALCSGGHYCVSLEYGAHCGRWLRHRHGDEGARLPVTRCRTATSRATTPNRQKKPPATEIRTHHRNAPCSPGSGVDHVVGHLRKYLSHAQRPAIALGRPHGIWVVVTFVTGVIARPNRFSNGGRRI